MAEQPRFWRVIDAHDRPHVVADALALRRSWIEAEGLAEETPR